MARKSKSEKPMKNVAEMQPDELGALVKLVKEYVEKSDSILNEIELLRQDQKELTEEYTDRIDIQTLKQVLKVLKIQSAVKRKDAFDTFLAALTKENDVG